MKVPQIGVYQSLEYNVVRTLVRSAVGLASVLVSVVVLAQAPPAAPTIVAIDGQDLQSTHYFTGLPLTYDGWTDLDAMITSAGYSDARIMYVSNAGDDSTGQVYTQAQVNALGGTPTNPSAAVRAFATGAAARGQMRKGFPDVVLFRRGDSWTDTGIGALRDVSGRSSTERSIVSAYGSSGELPTFRDSLFSGSGFSGEPIPFQIWNVIVAHLRRYDARRDPGSVSFVPGFAGSATISLTAGGGNLLFEGIHSPWNYGTTAQGADSRFTNVAFRRVSFTRNYPVSGSGHQAGGFFDSIDGLLLEETVADHNGWHPTLPGAEETIFNHNYYIQYTCTGVIARGNVLARAATNAMQGRPGGSYINNLSIDNPYPPFSAGGGGTYAYNVALGSANRRYGYLPGLGVQEMGSGAAVIEYNIVANKVPGVGGTAAAFHIMNLASLEGGAPYAGPKQTTFRGNVAHNWNGPGLTFGYTGSPSGGPVDYLIFENNKFSLPSTATYAVDIPAGFSVASTFSGNEYNAPSANAFRYNGTAMNFAAWAAATGEAGARFGPIAFPDPTRNIETYMESIGMSGGVPEFLAIAAGMHRWNWDERFTAKAVNSYIRYGFGVRDIAGDTIHR